MSLYGSLAPNYDALFPLPPAAPAFLGRLVPERPRAARRALDAGCATGSLALALAERGWEVLGIEPEPDMVLRARAEARGRGIKSARFEVGDMRDAASVALPGSYDLALCLGNTLPHLRPADVRAFLGAARRLLAPTGALVLQLVNYGRPGLGPGYAFPEIAAGELRLRRRYEAGAADDAGLRFVVELEDPRGANLSESLTLWPLPPSLLAAELAWAGFAAPALSSGWDGGGFDEGRDLYLLLVARPLFRA